MKRVVHGEGKIGLDELVNNAIDTVLENASDFISVASKLLLPTANLEKLIVDQVTLNFDAIVSGTMYTWTQNSSEPAHWAGGTSWPTSFQLPADTKPFNHLNLGGSANQQIFISGLQDLFTRTKNALSNKTGLESTIKSSVGGAAAPVTNIKYQMTATPTP